MGRAMDTEGLHPEAAAAEMRLREVGNRRSAAGQAEGHYREGPLSARELFASMETNGHPELAEAMWRLVKEEIEGIKDLDERNTKRDELLKMASLVYEAMLLEAHRNTAARAKLFGGSTGPGV